MESQITSVAFSNFTPSWYYSSFLVTLCVVQSHHSSGGTSIVWQLSYWYLSMYISLNNKTEQIPFNNLQDDLIFLILQKYVHISSTHTCAPTQIPTIPHCLRATVWTSDILRLITCSQHNTAQQTRRPISVSFLPLLPPHCHFLFSFILFRIEDVGLGGGLQ